MINQETLKEKIRSIYFGLISEASLYSYENLLANAAKELNHILKTTYTGLYLYNNTQNKYLKIGEEIDNLTTPDFLNDINQYIEQQNKSPSPIGGGIFCSNSKK